MISSRRKSLFPSATPPLNPFTSSVLKCWDFKCRSRYLVIGLFCILSIPFYLLHYQWNHSISISTAQSPLMRGVGRSLEYCQWSDASPWLFHLDMQLNVAYNAKQWFHVTENMLSKYKVRKEDAFSSDLALQDEKKDGKNRSRKEIYFHFRQVNFETQLIYFTSMMIYWGSLMTLPYQELSSVLTSSSVGSKQDSRELRNNQDTGITLHYFSNQDTLTQLSSADIGKGILLPIKYLDHQKTLSISSDGTKWIATDEFQSQSLHPNSVCVRYMGDITGNSRKRLQWFDSKEDASKFRNIISSTCVVEADTLDRYRKVKKYKLVFYQRDLSRRILDETNVLAQLQASLPHEDWEIVTYYHSEQISPCEWAYRLHNVDVFLSPHGFQFSLLYFLPRPSIILEVFPHRYYKVLYQRLAHEIGLSHAHWISEPTNWIGSLLGILTSPKTCSTNPICRYFARNSNVQLSNEGIDYFVRYIHQHLSELQHKPTYVDLNPHSKYVPTTREFLFT